MLSAERSELRFGKPVKWHMQFSYHCPGSDQVVPFLVTEWRGGEAMGATPQ